MITIEKVRVHGWEPAIRGMRNPLESWDKSDSVFSNGDWFLGEKDLDLMMRLNKAGSDHRKFMRMLTITTDITAPLFWWKEFDTYKVATVRNSCSTMHKIHSKPITLEDFGWEKNNDPFEIMMVSYLEEIRQAFLTLEDPTKKNLAWRTLIEYLPSAYLQKATIQFNYETARNMYNARKNHKLYEWHILCSELERLPVSELITL